MIHLTSAYLFVGLDGVINTAGYANAAAFESDLDAAGAVGFFVNNANLDLAIVGETVAGGKKWIGVAANIASLGIVGLPDAFSLKIKDLQFFYNVAASNGQRMDWQALAANTGDGFNAGLGALAQLDNTTDFKVAGSVYVAIENFVYLSGSVAIQRKELFVKTVGGTAATPMTVLTLGASDLRAFVGIGDADSDNNDQVDDVATLAQNAIGVSLVIDNLAIVLAKPVVTSGPPSTKSYFALSGSGSASLIGVDGVQIAGRVSISINNGADSALAAPGDRAGHRLRGERDGQLGFVRQCCRPQGADGTGGQPVRNRRLQREQPAAGVRLHHDLGGGFLPRERPVLVQPERHAADGRDRRRRHQAGDRADYRRQRRQCLRRRGRPVLRGLQRRRHH